MMDLKKLVTRKRAISSGIAVILLIGLTVPAAAITQFIILPMVADEGDRTVAEDVDLKKISELANVISGSAIEISIKNGGENRITIDATKIRCANSTEFPGSSRRTPWYPEDGIVEDGKTRSFIFVFEHHPAAYGAGTLQLVLTFSVGDDASSSFVKTIVIAMTGGSASEDVDLSKISELANVISGSAIHINVSNSGEDRITIAATKIRCANNSEFPGSSWRIPSWYPEDGVVCPGTTRTFNFVADYHPAAYGAGTLQLVITFYGGNDPSASFNKAITIAS